MASLAALIIALALGPAAASGGTPINAGGKTYIAVAEAGACRGNGGAELGDKVNQKLKQGLTQTECETECDGNSECLGYAFEDGASSAAAAYCIIYGPHVAGTCSNTFLDTIEKCAAQGTCSDVSVDACGIAVGDDCLAEMAACQNMGATWTSASSVWSDPINGWEGGAGNSFATTHIDGANGNSAYTCYDLDLDDHEATCLNSDSLSLTHGAVYECAATWTDTSVSGCVDMAGCPAAPCNSDDTEAWCCETADCGSAWHYCGCERDFEAGGKLETACDVAAGCVYTAAPVMESVNTVNPGDTVGCSNVYTPMLGACRGTDSAGAQVGVNGKGSRGCDIDGVKKVCGGTGEPICEITQAECEAGCAAENAIAPGRCEAYHWAPDGWCTIHGPHVHEGIGWDATAGAAAADSCWSYWPADVTAVDGTNTNTLYMCYMVKDKTVNADCVYPTDGASAATLAFGAALAAGLLA